MALAIVNVVVPLSGDGPAADISALVGQKTVELSGTFEGRYILLGSHDGVSYVPVLIFDANGDESIKVTLPGAVKLVAVRASVLNAVGVTMNICGVAAPGTNYFGALASIPAGFSGVLPPVDLFALFPPTGLEQDINFMCEGNFKGLITLDGSLDGVHFNPLGGFRAEGFGGNSPLEYTPFATLGQVRYIRITVQAISTTPITVTIGGNTPANSGAAAFALSLPDDEGKVYVSPQGAFVDEGILYEFAVDLAKATAPTITAQISGIIRAEVGINLATFNVYLGATTPGDTTGGSLVATINTNSFSDVAVSGTGLPFINPGVLTLVQVTGKITNNSYGAYIRGLSLIIG